MVFAWIMWRRMEAQWLLQPLTLPLSCIRRHNPHVYTLRGNHYLKYCPQPSSFYFKCRARAREASKVKGEGEGACRELETHWLVIVWSGLCNGSSSGCPSFTCETTNLSKWRHSYWITLHKSMGPSILGCSGAASTLFGSKSWP